MRLAWRARDHIASDLAYPHLARQTAFLKDQVFVTDSAMNRSGRTSCSLGATAT